jgi:putative peptidoglycan lipid II flippase
MVAAPLIMQLLGPQIQNPQTCAFTVKLTRIILPAQLFFYWGRSSVRYKCTKEIFFFPALAPLCYNGGIIVAGIILAPRPGIEGFCLGGLRRRIHRKRGDSGSWSFALKA